MNLFQVKKSIQSFKSLIKSKIYTTPRRLYKNIYLSESEKQQNLKRFISFDQHTKTKENSGWNIVKLLGIGGLIVGGLQLILWNYEENNQNATVVDVGWVSGVGMLSCLYSIKGRGEKKSRQLAGLFSVLWSLRLTSHLINTRIIGKQGEEDGRYQRLRKKWGENASRNFFIFFQAQALLSIFFSIPALICSTQTKIPNKIQMLLCSVLVLLSIGGEAISDYQLAKFKENKENKGKVCEVGLWNYSRHPNYFFEWSYWWSYVILSFGRKHWWITLLAPFTMLFLIFKVTGISATEEQALATKGEQYRNYQKTTSTFIPWFKKNNK